MINDDALSFIKKNHLDRYYPDVINWYQKKVLPDLLLGNREIITICNNGVMQGLGIIKKSEKKICTLIVDQDHRSRGIGCALMDLMIDRLQTKKPLITISESVMPSYEKMIKKYDFKLTQIVNGAYVQGVNEYYFSDLSAKIFVDF